MALKSTLLLALVSAVAAHGDADGIVNSTAKVISSLQSKAEAAKQRFTNINKFEKELDDIGAEVEAGFDTKRYSEEIAAFSDLEQRATEKAKQSLASDNITEAEESMEDAEDLLQSMTKVGDKLDTLETALRARLQDALNGKLDPELTIADKLSGEASKLQHEAHDMMHPLYGLGDKAQDKADKFNDQTNDALSKVEKLVRAFRRRITEHSVHVQRGVESKLFAGSPDRRAAWRKVHSLVRQATGHVSVQQYIAKAGTELGSFKGMAVLSTMSVTTAALGALMMSFIVKMRARGAVDYHLLSA